VAGRYREGGPATITLTGTANGRQQTFTYADQAFRDEGGEAFIPRLWATRAIGHLMQQVRLRGEDAELVQSIVNLSTRYGIITPYTSFLIEEDDIFAQTDGAPPADLALEALAAPEEASGAAAVDRAAAEGELAAAAAPLPMATMVAVEESGQIVAQAPVRTAGSRTFFLRDGVWVDSVFDAATEPQVVAFATDAYFDLLAARPELGEALALGEEVIVVVDGAAYRITGEGGETAEVTLPATVEAQSNNAPIAQTDLTPEGLETASRESVGIQVCGVGLLLPVIVGAVGWGASRRRKR
jgi:Ca-activated chloride channel family protein